MVVFIAMLSKRGLRFSNISFQSFVLKTLERIVDLVARGSKSPAINNAQCRSRSKSEQSALSNTLFIANTSPQPLFFILKTINNVCFNSIERALNKSNQPIAKWIMSVLNINLIIAKIGNYEAIRWQIRGTPVPPSFCILQESIAVDLVETRIKQD